MKCFRNGFNWTPHSIFSFRKMFVTESSVLAQSTVTIKKNIIPCGKSRSDLLKMGWVPMNAKVQPFGLNNKILSVHKMI